MDTIEVNIDGLVGPTHNYAGLSFGNVASERHALSESHPMAAALQGLNKMKFLHDLGIPQLVMPPHPRPEMNILHQLGFTKIEDVPDDILYPIYSASAMWTANAATVSPAADTEDGKTHFTPANLSSKFHRSIEPAVTAQYLKKIFPEPHFVHHAPLPAHHVFSDEGAANHMRLCKGHGAKGLEIFVYGGESAKYPARQSLHASQAVARLHGLETASTLFLRQSARAIDAGVFHNDVIAMSNETLMVYHETAYDNLDTNALAGFTPVMIREQDLSLAETVSTYFFNSQLVSLPEGGMAVIAPSECGESPAARRCFDRLVEDGHIKTVHYLNLRESMQNGGGPACLRLRVPLTSAELKAVHPGAVFNDALYSTLCQWIKKHYRDRISFKDLRDPTLAEASRAAISELYTLMSLA
ncbi:MAG TPA: N-succinylarginine dihydrolase [Rickettsiales bacterium]|nr:N-succinylarginine dihydrolase [Rickettsiales bacterium]